MTHMSPTPSVHRVRPAGPPTLAAHQLHAAQAATLAAPRLRYDPFSRLMFFSVDLLYGRKGSLKKFVVLEYLARIPYQAWEKVAYRAIARSEGRSALAHRIMERVVDARAQHDNEQYHLLIFEDLLRRRGIRLGRLRFRILPRLMGGPWHLFVWTLHLLRPAWSYRLNAAFEDHAEHEYMRFVAEHPELDHEPFDCTAARGYGRFASLADLLRQIGHDERVHKLESLALASTCREPRPGDDDELIEPEAA
jgi:ubiquinol oxidase